MRASKPFSKRTLAYHVSLYWHPYTNIPPIPHCQPQNDNSAQLIPPVDPDELQARNMRRPNSEINRVVVVNVAPCNKLECLEAFSMQLALNDAGRRRRAAAACGPGCSTIRKRRAPLKSETGKTRRGVTGVDRSVIARAEVVACQAITSRRTICGSTEWQVSRLPSLGQQQ